MSEVELIEQLDQAIEAMLANPSAPLTASEKSVGDLLAIAVDLRALPDSDFKLRLRNELQKEALMSTAPEKKQGSVEPSRSKANPVREGFRTVTPYLTVADIHAEIEFITKVFGATGKIYGLGSAGGFHSEYKVGESMLMIGGGGKGSRWKGTPTPSALHLYDEDVDAVYERAIQARATSLMPPTNMDYGERGAAIEDIGGTHWSIATSARANVVPHAPPDLTPSIRPLCAPQRNAYLREACP